MAHNHDVTTTQRVPGVGVERSKADMSDLGDFSTQRGVRGSDRPGRPHGASPPWERAREHPTRPKRSGFSMSGQSYRYMRGGMVQRGRMSAKPPPQAFRYASVPEKRLLAHPIVVATSHRSDVPSNPPTSPLVPTGKEYLCDGNDGTVYFCNISPTPPFPPTSPCYAVLKRLVPAGLKTQHQYDVKLPAPFERSSALSTGH
jgi:hypothetical protein